MLQLNFSPFPILESERLCFRKLTNEDAPEILALRGNPETMQFIPRPLITDFDGALAHIKMINDKIDENVGINEGFVDGKVEGLNDGNGDNDGRLVGRDVGHSYLWKNKAQEIGCSANVTRERVITERPNYIYSCPKCKATISSFRIFRKEKACRKCCEQYNHGIFTRQFLFKLVNQ